MSDVKDIEFNEIPNDLVSSGDAGVSLESVYKNVDVSLEAVIGGLSITLDKLSCLKKDEVLVLKQHLNSKVLLKYQGKTVAQGNLVAVEKNYGVEITDVYLKQ